MKASLIEMQSDGSRSYALELSKEEYEELEKLDKFRGVGTVEETIVACIEIEIEGMY